MFVSEAIIASLVFVLIAVDAGAAVVDVIVTVVLDVYDLDEASVVVVVDF